MNAMENSEMEDIFDTHTNCTSPYPHNHDTKNRYTHTYISILVNIVQKIVVELTKGLRSRRIEPTPVGKTPLVGRTRSGGDPQIRRTAVQNQGKHLFGGSPNSNLCRVQDLVTIGESDHGGSAC